MPRVARPWHRKGRDSWMVTYKGRVVNLGIQGAENEQAAIEAYRKLLAEGLPDETIRPAGLAVDHYLSTLTEVAPVTRVVYRTHLNAFLKAVGRDGNLARLNAESVEKTAKGRNWSPSTVNSYLGTVGVFLKSSGIVLDRPLKRPPKESRGASSLWSEEEYWRIVGACRGDFRGIVQVLYATGARPSEIAELTVEAVNWSIGCAALNKHKNSRKGKPRVIHFPESALAILKAQREKHGDGLLFRQGAKCKDRNGRLDRHCLMRRMVLARRRAGIKKPLTLYGLRHTAITRALSKGFSPAQVAALVGNSAAIIERFYGHVGSNVDLMKQMAAAIAG